MMVKSKNSLPFRWLQKTMLLTIIVLFGIWFFYGENKIKIQDDFIPKVRTNKTRNSIMCIVLASEKTILDRCKAIWNTWGPECDDIIFACNCKNVIELKNFHHQKKKAPERLKKYDAIIDLPILNINFTENYEKMGEKVLIVLNKVYKNYNRSSDWFFMVDDDTFVFVDNLRNFIQTKNTNDAFYYGFKYKHLLPPKGYIGGGSGILFSNESMKRLVGKIDKNECNEFLNLYGDVTIGGCANSAGIEIGSSEDKTGRPRFNYMDPYTHYNGPLPWYLGTLGIHNNVTGKQCCSPESISFHYVQPDLMMKLYSKKSILTELFA